MRDILRVGAASSIVSLSTNVSIATATGLAGLVGPAAVAGYGTGARLEYLLVPLVFGLGAPVAAMVGTCIGAGRRDRALRVAWTGAAIAFGLTEAIGLAAALVPAAWLSLFGQRSDDDRGRNELSADRRPVLWLLRRRAGAVLRLAGRGPGRLGDADRDVARHHRAGGGWFAVTKFGGSTGLFAALAAALVVYGLPMSWRSRRGHGSRRPKSLPSRHGGPKALPVAQPSR